jgi:hypothetical protein
MTDDARHKFQLIAGTVVCDFVLADNFVDIIQGDIGSGKTNGCLARIMRHAQQQRPSTFDGIRKSRWAIVRNNYPDLKRSTIRSWVEMFPENLYGRLNWAQPPSHKMRFNDVALEADFLALDSDDDVSRLRSVEYTGIYFNELQYIIKTLFDEATSRVGRYPARSEGGTQWRGVIADCNAPDEDHWLAMMTGQVDVPPGLDDEERRQFQWPQDKTLPSGEVIRWRFWKQPPALLETRDARGLLTGYQVNPGAENLHNLEPGYYDRILLGKKKEWIDSRLRNTIALVVEGSPVWPMFRADTHVALSALQPVQGYDVVVGLDFGRRPAAVFMQAINNRVYVQYELQGFNMGATVFAPMVKRFLAEHYPDYQVRAYGDPKGQDKGQTDERTAYEVFEANGIHVVPPPGLKMNMIATRVDAVASLLNEMYDGRPRFVLSPACRSLKVGMSGRYCNERDEKGELSPKKDRYSDLADALQYGSLGLGEGRRMIGHKPLADMRPVQWHKRKTMRRISA